MPPPLCYARPPARAPARCGLLLSWTESWAVPDANSPAAPTDVQAISPYTLLDRFRPSLHRLRVASMKRRLSESRQSKQAPARETYRDLSRHLEKKRSV